MRTDRTLFIKYSRYRARGHETPGRYTGRRRLSRLSRATVMSACLLLPGSSFGAVRSSIEIGQYVEVKTRAGDRLTARSIVIEHEAAPGDEDAGKTVIRGRIDWVDEARSAVWALGQEIAITSRTRVPSTVTSLSDLTPGDWIKIYANVGPDHIWSARRLEVDDVPRRQKIEGQITSAWPDTPYPDSIAIHGLVIRVPANTRINDHAPTASERIFRKIIAPRDPRRPLPWLISPHLWSRGKLSMIQRFENDFTIGDSTGDQYREAEPQLRLEFAAKGPAGITGNLKLRTRNTFVLENAPLRQRNRELGVQIYEGFALWRDVLGAPVALQVGRQDFDEYREWLFDDQLDAARAYLYPTYPIVAEVAYIHSLDNSKSNKFATVTDYLGYVHGKVIPGAEVGAYRLWRTDTDARRGREPIWTGLRYRGDHWGVRPWFDIAWLRGWDKHRRLKSHAVDLGVTVVRNLGRVALSATVANARGSGNTAHPKTTNMNHQFEQTGYEDNTGTFNGVASFQYYGEILDPELSNLDILTIAGGLNVASSASVEIIYHRYRQVKYEQSGDFYIRGPRELESTDLTVFDDGGRWLENGKSYNYLWPYRDLGWEIDIVSGINLVAGLLEMKWVLGFFGPGNALWPPEWEQNPFITSDKRTAILSQLSVAWRF